MTKVFYIELFRAMARHITESMEFQQWLMVERVSWEDPDDMAMPPRQREDWEMVALYLDAIADTSNGRMVR